MVMQNNDFLDVDSDRDNVDYDLDTAITAYVEMTFTEEQGDLIRAAFDLFDVFSLTTAYDGFANLLFGYNMNDGDMDDTRRSMMFLVLVKEKLDYILKEHGVLIESENLADYVRFVKAIFFVQTYNDPETLINCFEGLTEPDLAYCKMLAIVGGDDALDYFTVLKRLAPGVIKTTRTFLDEKKEELSQEKGPESKKFVKAVKDFFKCFGTEILAHRMVEAGVHIGYAFENYIPHVKSLLIAEDDETTAMNILSVMMISADTQHDPVMAYRSISETLLPPEKIMSVGSILGKKFSDYQRSLGA